MLRKAAMPMKNTVAPNVPDPRIEPSSPKIEEGSAKLGP